MIRKIAALAFIAVVFMLQSAHAQEWWNSEWSFRKEITVNAGEGGVNVASDLASFPTLIRLSADSFDFANAQFDGSDIRITTADGRRLNHFVESFDVNGSLGFVWVETPRIEPGTEQTLYIYYGNNNADDAGQSSLVYDDNFAVVYNFGAISGVPQDATSNLNHARSTLDVQPGFIGNAAVFDGEAVLLTPPASSLNVAPGGAFTVSAWVRVPEGQENAVLYARGPAEAPALVLSLAGLTPTLTLAGAPDAELGTDVEAGEEPGGEQVVLTADRSLAPGQWAHIALRATAGENGAAALFLNGEKAGELALSTPRLDGETYFGGFPASNDEDPRQDGYRGLVGVMDEIRVSRAARSDAWIRTSYLDQGPAGSLVRYGVNEELTEEFFNFQYFQVVVANLSAEAWMIIAILAGMLVIAVVTIMTKAGLVNRIEKGNKRFRRAYRDADAIDAVDGKFGPSGMARIYRTAIVEAGRRGGVDGIAGARLDASAQAAIRSEVDAALTEHVQEMNRRMVLLTIAISGGPFLGLLGTVLGVMITFAGVAAEGNVNINAIAPGVAAALMTTVTGLSVAIPSMFAYNWLTTRMREIASQTRVFANTLTARISDTLGD